jgi:hypothetical protein
LFGELQFGGLAYLGAAVNSAVDAGGEPAPLIDDVRRRLEILDKTAVALR